jgi:hypothetical protein
MSPLHLAAFSLCVVLLAGSILAFVRIVRAELRAIVKALQGRWPEQ